MNTQKTLEQLQQLKLTGMYQRYKSILEMPAHQQPQDMHALMALVTIAEKEHRSHQQTNRYLRRSKLRYNAVPEEIKCTPERNLSKDTLALLADGTYIKKGRNILITGPTGCGKSFLACALGRQACEQGYSSNVINLRLCRLIIHMISSFGLSMSHSFSAWTYGEGTFGNILQ